MELVKSINNQKIIKKISIIVIGTIILTLSAKIKIPFYPVPMTMQTFVVLFLGVSLGYKIALATVSLYLVEGILGLPVFSNSPEKGVGLVYFTGPTMGYLIGFLFAVFLAGYFNYKGNILSNFVPKPIFSPPSLHKTYTPPLRDDYDNILPFSLSGGFGEKGE